MNDNTKQFYFSISDDTTMKKKISVDNPQQKTKNDIKKQIQNELNISMDKFDLNIDDKEKISTLRNKFIIVVKFKKTCQNINFIFPNEKNVTINNSNNMNFETLVLKFNQKGYYFSPKYSNNVDFQTMGFKISKISLKLDFIPEGEKVQVINENSISINYKNKYFFFESGEIISKAEDFIRERIRVKLVEIHSCNPNSKSKSFLLKEKYSTKLTCTYIFTAPNGKSYEYPFGSDATVGDAKIFFSNIYCDHNELNKDSIKIFDADEEITNNKTPLKELKELRFDIIPKGDLPAAPKSKDPSIPKQDKPAPNKKSSIPKANKPNSKLQQSKQPKSNEKPTDSSSKLTQRSSTDGNIPQYKQPPGPAKAVVKKDTAASKANLKPAANKAGPIPPIRPITPKNPVSKPSTPLFPTTKKSSLSQAKPQSPKAAPKPTAPKPEPKEEEKPKPKPKIKAPHIKITTTEVKDDDDDDTNSNSDSGSGEKLEINFIFEESVGRSINPVKINVGLETTIEKVSKKIAKKYDIPNIVEIKYRDGDEKITIDKDMTIEDIKDDMEQKDGSGRSKNVLYVGSKVPKSSSSATSSKATKPKKNYKPSIKSTEDDDDVKKPARVDLYAIDHYVFSFDEEEKDITLKKESLLSEHVDMIKKKFGISKDEEIGFKIAKQDIKDDDDDGKVIEDLNQKMKNFEDQILLVYLKDEDAASIYLTVNRMKDKNAKIDTYYYITNVDDEKHQVDLDSKATVKSIKRHIKRSGLFEVTSLSNIKVLFAGKDLLDNLNLHDLEIGDSVLYIYIRSMDDILLMTAKALKVDEYDDDDDDDNNDNDDDDDDLY